VKDAAGQLTEATITRHSQMVGVGKIIRAVYEKWVSGLSHKHVYTLQVIYTVVHVMLQLRNKYRNMLMKALCYCIVSWQQLITSTCFTHTCDLWFTQPHQLTGQKMFRNLLNS
jgi:hypothetical protein